MAPITPFITEEIYQTYFKKHEKSKSIHLTEWPKEIKVQNKKDDEKVWNKMMETIYQVRQAKSRAQKSMKAEIILTLPKQDKVLLKDVLEDLKSVTCAKEISEGQFEIKIL